MPVTYNADEIFEMAEQMERNGAKFYRKAAEKFDDAATRDVLSDLTAMEARHQKTFAEIRSELNRQQRTALVYDPEDEAGKYLRAMTDGYVFDFKADPIGKLDSGVGPAEILRIAIGLEKDSVVFYLGLKGCVSEQAGKDKVDNIIAEEMGHIATLTEKLEALSN